jgi:hypothetical protein
MAALVYLKPHAIEASPLPGSSRGNGGRCCPHSLSPSYLPTAQTPCKSRFTGAASLNRGVAP